MLNTMALRCEECGYDNNPQFRFCGMCGAPLSPPTPAEVEPAVPRTAQVAPKRDTPAQPNISPLSGPSVLGLSDETSDRTPTYLLEDDESSSHRGRYLLLILLVLAAALAGWHYRQEILAGSGLATNPAAGSSASDNAGAGLSPSPAQVAPATANGSNPAEQPKTATSDQAPPPQTPAAAAPQSTAPPASSQASENAQAGPTQPPQNPESKETASSSAEAPAPVQPAPVANPTSKTTAASRSPALKRQPAATAETGDDYLVTEGEKYLYGNGVPQNCARARKDLLAAAEHSNTRAQSVLGTMYATGHCATRDLPAAYRWFARALHKDPSNTRIEQDLEILWRQMSPTERQIAQSKEQ
jgi:TPR repeat protein